MTDTAGFEKQIHAICQSSDTPQTLTSRLLDLFAQASGCEAVAMRLRSGNDYPFIAFHGFPEEFVSAEYSLSAAEIHCLHASVRTGYPDPDRDTAVQNRCSSAVNESVALIPLKYLGDTVGLILFNDREKENFSGGMLQKLERLVDLAAPALAALEARQARIDIRNELEETRTMTGLGRWEYDLSGNRMHFSDSALEIFGLDSRQSEIGFSDFLDCVHPDDRLKVDKAYAESLGTRNPYKIEYRVITGSGSVRWISQACRTDCDRQGKPVLTIGIAQNVTDRKQADEELSASRNLLDKIFEILPVGLWIADSTGRLIRSNPAVRRIWGADHLVDRKGYGIFKARRLPSREEIAPGDWALVRTITQGVTVLDEVLEIDAFDNQKRTILNYSAPVLDKNRKVEAAVIVNLDITERQKTDDTMHFLANHGWVGSAENFFQALARFLAEHLDMDYICIDVLEGDLKSARTLAIFYDGDFQDNVSYTLADTPCGEVVGKTVCCFPRDVRNLFPGDAVLVDICAESYLGTTLWDSRGEAIGLIAAIGRKPLVDSSLAESVLGLVAVRAAGELERMQSESSLERSERKFRSFVENANDLIYTLTPKGEFSYIAPNWKRLLGHDTEEMLGHRFSEFIHPDDRRTIEASFQRILDTGSTDQELGYRVFHKDGSCRWHVSAASTFRDSSGTTVFLGIAHDITARKESEEKMAAQMEELKRWHAVTLGREKRILELKSEVNDLRRQANLSSRYGSPGKSRDE